MKKKIIILGIIVILLTIGLSGCNERKSIDSGTEQEQESELEPETEPETETPISEKIIGKWYATSNRISDVWIFTSNGKLTLSNQVVTYVLDDDEIGFNVEHYYTLMGSEYSYYEYYEFDIQFDNEETVILSYIKPYEFRDITIVLTR